MARGIARAGGHDDPANEERCATPCPCRRRQSWSRREASRRFPDIERPSGGCARASETQRGAAPDRRSDDSHDLLGDRRRLPRASRPRVNRSACPLSAKGKEISMFSHLTIGTHDLARATAFYDAVLTPLGIER